MIATRTQFTGVDGQPVHVSQSQIDGLERRMEGHILQPDQPGWDDATTIWNAMWTARPALIAQPASARDVSTIINVCRSLGLLVSIKGGGHNIAGTAVADNGVMIDMSGLRDVSVDPVARLAHVGGGCLLGDVDRATQEFGLATVLGLVSDVGVAGLTLGGGFGNLCRRFGWAVDNLDSVEIVTADGTIREASRDQEPDLFWAIRGGGGNFGVITRFTFRLHEVGPIITGGLMFWPADRATDVFEAFQTVTDRGRRELFTGMIVATAPPAPFIPAEFHGKNGIGVLVCHSGTDSEDDIAPFRKVGNPVADLIAPRPYVEQQQILNDMEPKGFNQYWKAEYMPGLSSAYLDTALDVGLNLTSPHSYTITLQLGGAITDRAGDDGAVGNRNAEFIGGVAAMWEDDGRDAEHIAWARDGWHRIKPFSTGGNYVNFQMPDDDSARTAAAYGANYHRLQTAKSVYDPDNFFQVNRNVSPTATT